MSFFKLSSIYALGRLLSFGSVFAIAAFAGPAAWGIHVYARSLMELPTALSRGGTELSAYLEMPRVSHDSAKQTAERILSNGIFLLGVGCLTTLTITIPFQDSGPSQIHLVVVFLAAPFIYVSGAAQHLTASLKLHSTVAVEQVLAPLMRIFVFFPMFFLFNSAIQSLAVSFILSCILTAILSYLALLKQLGHISIFRLNLIDRKSLRSQFQFGINSLLASAPGRIDILIAATSLGFTETGRYALLFAAGSVASPFISAASRLIAPLISDSISKNYSERGGAELYNKQRTLTQISLPVYAAVNIGMLLIGPYIHLPRTTDISAALNLILLSVFLGGTLQLSGFALSLGGRLSQERRVLLTGTIILALTSWSLSVMKPQLSSIALGCFLSVLITAPLRDHLALKILKTRSFGVFKPSVWIMPILTVSSALALEVLLQPPTLVSCLIWCGTSAIGGLLLVRKGDFLAAKDFLSRLKRK